MSSTRSYYNGCRRSHFSLHYSIVAAFAIVIALVIEVRVAEAVIPSVEVSLRTATTSNANGNGNDYSQPTTTLLLSQAFFGPDPPFQKTSSNSGGSSNSEDNINKRLVSPPVSNPFLCQERDGATIDIDREILESTKGAWILVPRGGCTYEYKTWIAQSIYESAGVIIYNTLASRYSFNETETDTDTDGATTDGATTDNNNAIVWPLEYHDYDCKNARAEIPSNDLSFFSKAAADGSDTTNTNINSNTGPYDFETNDSLLSGDTADNLCKMHDANNLRNCPSKRCLVARDVNVDADGDKTAATAVKDTTTVCCAWDVRLNPYPDRDLEKNVTVAIPTLFATMEQGEIFSEAMETFSSSLTIVVYSRRCRRRRRWGGHTAAQWPTLLQRWW